MGMVYKRRKRNKDGTVIEGRVWWIKYYQNGKPYSESTKSTKESVAKRLLNKRLGEIAEGKVPGIYFDKVRFEELAKDYLTDYEVNGKRSLDKAQVIVKKHLSPFFHDMHVTDISSAKIKQYVHRRQEENAQNATINRDLSALKRMFNLAARCTPSKVALVPHIPMLAENNVRSGFFEHDEFLALRDALPDYLKDMVTFANKSGWRLREITGLKWEQVDLKQGVVCLNPGSTKNKEGWTFYLDDELKTMFRSLFVEQVIGCPYVFQVDGKSIGSFRKTWKAACKKAGLKDRIFHDFRRTAVRNMVRAGIPERVAITISGHKTRSVFDRYNIVDDNDLRQASEKMSAFLESQMVTPTVTPHRNAITNRINYSN